MWEKRDATRDRGLRTAVPALLLLIFAGLRLWGIRAPTLWNDEIISLSLAGRSWYGLIHGAVADRVHPPLFYALLKVWIAIGGEGVVWLRLLPLSLAALALVPAVLLCRELRLPRRVEWLAVFLIATSGFLIHYAQEIRMYSLALLLSLASLWQFARWARRPGRDRWTGAGLAAANSLLVFTHYYGWLVVAAEGLFLVLRFRDAVWRFVVLTVAPAAAFAPWALQVARRMAADGGLERNLAGLARPGVAEVLGFFSGAAGPLAEGGTSPARMAPGLVLLALPVGIFAVRTLTKRDAPTRWPSAEAESERRFAAGFLGWFALFPVAVSVGVSLLARPVFHPRYLTVAVVPWLILAAVCLEALRPARLAAAWTVAACAWALAGTVAELRDGGRPAWGELAAQVRGGACSESRPARAQTPVYVVGRVTIRPVRYYLGSDRRFGVVPVVSPDQIVGDEVWVTFQSSDGAAGPSPDWGSWKDIPAPAIREAARARGYRVACELRSGDPESVGYAMKLVRQGAP